MNTATNSIWRAELDGRDLVEVSGRGAERRVKILGCEAFLSLAEQLRAAHGDDPEKWPVPEGKSHSELLIRELILKLQSQWHPPSTDAEICHCRMIPTLVVEQAIVSGAHTSEMVSRWTTASTACGTCRPDVEKLIQYRLGLK